MFHFMDYLLKLASNSSVPVDYSAHALHGCHIISCFWIKALSNWWLGFPGNVLGLQVFCWHVLGGILVRLIWATFGCLGYSVCWFGALGPGSICLARSRGSLTDNPSFHYGFHIIAPISIESWNFKGLNALIKRSGVHLH